MNEPGEKTDWIQLVQRERRNFACHEITFFASGGQGLFLKKPPLDPAKTFY
jgi:hypothetical protein